MNPEADLNDQAKNFRLFNESLDIMKDENKARQVQEELADVLQYAIRLADVLSIDLNQALWDKLHRNEEKYPIAKSKGSAKKYTEFERP